jgi:hypothetical protein
MSACNRRKTSVEAYARRTARNRVIEVLRPTSVCSPRLSGANLDAAHVTGWKSSRTGCTGIVLGEEILRELLDLGLLNGGGLVRSAFERLERLGYKVTVEPT